MPCLLAVILSKDAEIHSHQWPALNLGIYFLWLLKLTIKPKTLLKCLKSLNSSVLFVKSLFGDDQLNYSNNSRPFGNLLMEWVLKQACSQGHERWIPVRFMETVSCYTFCMKIQKVYSKMCPLRNSKCAKWKIKAGLGALKNIVIFKAKLALPFPFLNSRPETYIQFS